MVINKQEISNNEFYSIYKRNENNDIDCFLQKESPVIVIGGVSNGSSISNYLKKYSKPFIYGFEPNPNLTIALKITKTLLIYW